MSVNFLTLFRRVLFRTAHERGAQMLPYSNSITYISHTDKTCYGHNLAKGDPKKIKTYKSRYILLVFCRNQHFSLKISNFYNSGNRYRTCILIPNLQFFTGLQLCQCEQNWQLPFLIK